ncbi:MAG TPA: lysophospholipid acyltransferase family protein [Myxococcota bacterium]|nr:lysophospholipid acyltransferase family protein [Myxococcota bacterium]
MSEPGEQSGGGDLAAPGELERGEVLSDELREALDDLRGEIRSRFPAREAPRIEKIDWIALAQAFQRRLTTLMMSERSGEVDEFGMDEIVLRRARPLLELLYGVYWRVDLGGIERIPDAGPCLLVANASGLLPYDALMVSHAISRERADVRPRFMVADWLITLPFVQPYLARLGGVRACRENAERLLRSGQTVLVFPEGQKGAAKVFRERYRLKRFGRGGVVRVALETRVPIVPIGIVGAEEAHPILFKWTAPGRAVGLPFLPVTPTFPLFGPLGLLPLPTKWLIRIGEPIPVDHLAPDAALDELLISRMNEELRSRIQLLVDAGLADRSSVWEGRTESARAVPLSAE